jgi:hypothetical protein
MSDDLLSRLRTCARRRERYSAALAQANRDFADLLAAAKAAGLPAEDVQRAVGGKPEPRLVRANGNGNGNGPRRERQPATFDARSEGWWRHSGP